jgi:hypothetical protein
MWLLTGYGLDIGFIDTTRNYNAIFDLRYLQITSNF